MNRKHVNAAITAGLALTMTVGSVPPQAFAEMMQGDTTQVVAEQSDAAGAAATSADTGQATSEDQAVDKIASLAEQTDLHVAEGSDATLPQTVAVTYESGVTKQENVTWKLNGVDAPATLAQLPAGSYEFEGTVDGATQTVKQRVIIEAPADPAAVNAVAPVSSNEDLKIASVDSTPIVKKYVGQGYVGEEYGTSVNLTLTNGTKATGMVNWDEASRNTIKTASDESEVPIQGSISYINIGSMGYSLSEPYSVTATLKVFVPRSSNYTQSVTTSPGVAPSLPSTAHISYSDNSGCSCDVEWDEVSEVDYQKPGSFVVEGHLTHSPSTLVSCTVNVREIKSVQTEFECMTAVGMSPSLPYQAMVSFDQNESQPVHINWDSVNPDSYAQPGTFVVKGRLDGLDRREVTCTVTVKDAKDYFDLDSLTYERVVGDESPLDSGVHLKVTRPDGEYWYNYPVEWENADASRFQTAGTYEVTGTIGDCGVSSLAGLKVKAKVVVKEVASIAQVAPIDTPVGIRPTTGSSAGSLPYSVRVTFTDGSTVQGGVTWDTILDSMVAQEGSFTLGGSISYSRSNPGSPSMPVSLGSAHRASIKVNVRALQMPSATSVSTLIGAQIHMPYTIEATMWNGSRGSYSVQWPAISQNTLNKLGQSTITGYFLGSNIPVTATINVCDLADDDLGRIAFVPGVGLVNSYGSNQFLLSDGNYYSLWGAGDSLYTWDEIPQDLKNGKPGDYEITGTITGTLARVRSTATCGEVKGINHYSEAGPALVQSYEDTYVIYPGEQISLDNTTVDGILKDGTKFSGLKINWDEYDSHPSENCTITGKVAGTNIPATIHVIVTDKWKAELDTIKVLKGHDGSELLPTSVYLVSPDVEDHPSYHSKYASVTWNTEGFDWNQGGIVSGTAQLSYYTGSNSSVVDIPVTANVQVVNRATSVQGGTVWTVPGTEPALPRSLEVVYDSDMSAGPQRENVTWDEISPDAYAKDGSFKVKGKLSGGAEATVTVDVCSITSMSVPERITTVSGVIPELPWDIKVTTSDNNVRDAWIQWDEVRAQSYTGEPGKVSTVTGKVNAYGLDRYSDSAYTGVTVQTKIVIAGVEKAFDNGETAVTTKVGTVPAMPSVMAVELSDGSVSNATVEWDPIAPEKYEKPDTFYVTGRVVGFDGAAVMALVDDEGQKVGVDENGVVTAKVTVADEKAQKVALQPEVVVVNTTVGSTLELPDQATVKFSDGSYRMTQSDAGGIEIEEWADTDGLDIKKPLAKTGTYKLVGKLKGIDNVNAIVYVNVREAPRTITKLEAKSFSVAKGTSKQDLYQQMPKQVVATYSDGSTDLLDIDVWDLSNVTDEVLNGTSTVQITGTVKVTGAKVTCNVTVVDQDAETPDHVESIPDIQIADNAKVADLMDKLPSKVTVVMKDGKTKNEMPVKWSQVDSLGRAGNEFEVTGLTDNGMTVTVKVKVTARIVSLDPAKGIEVERDTKAADVLKKLPEKVAAVYSDGSESAVDVTWDTGDLGDKDFAKEGKVTVKGTVAGTDQKAECTIKVVKPLREIPDHLAGTVDAVTVDDGAKPEAVVAALPTTVKVAMKDGSEVDSKIDWTAPKEALTIKKDGTSVVITGKTAVGNFDVKATVNLKPVVGSVVGVQLSVARNTAADDIALPAQVTLNMSDGSTKIAAVTWDKAPLTTDALGKLGDIALEGTVEGTSVKAKCTVTVVKSDAEIPVSVEPVAGVSVPENSSADVVRDALKGVKATVRMKDGKTTAVSEITWTEVPAAAATYGNTVVAKGVTVNGNLPVEVVVTSTTTINKVAEAPQITVERDAKADAVTDQLPKTVSVTYTDGHADLAAVTWNTDGLDKQLAAVGEHTIEGSVEGTTLKATCKLVVETPKREIPHHVKNDSLTLEQPVLDGTSSEDITKALAGLKATVVMADGKTEVESGVTWADVPAADIATTGKTLTVRGTTEQGGFAVTATVSVKPVIKSASLAEGAGSIAAKRDDKVADVVAQLPKQASAMYSDDTAKDLDITWDTSALTQKALGELGDIIVTGTVKDETGSATVTATVTVSEKDSNIPVTPGTLDAVKVFEFSSPDEVLKALPKKVAVTMKDGSQKDYGIDWENVPALGWGADDATVTGKVHGTELTVSCEVRVKPRPAADGMVIVDQNGKPTTAETTLKVERGKEIDLAAAASNADKGAMLRGPVTWTSSDPTIATVENGKVKALKNGTVVITATMDVNGGAVAISLADDSDAVEAPTTQQFTASVTVEVVEPVVEQKPTDGKDNGGKSDAKPASDAKKDGKKAAAGSLAQTGDNTAVTVAALGGTGLLALIAAAIEKLRHRAE